MDMYIADLIKTPLSYLENHKSVGGIERIVAADFPIHFAIHEIDIDSIENEYCTSHAHIDEDEINIILSHRDSKLRYSFFIEDSHMVYDAPQCLLIPAKKTHSANVIKGRGFFICMRFPEGSLNFDSSFSK